MPDLDSLFTRAEVEAKIARHRDRQRRAVARGDEAAARRQDGIIGLCLSKWRELPS